MNEWDRECSECLHCSIIIEDVAWCSIWWRTRKIPERKRMTGDVTECSEFIQASH